MAQLNITFTTQDEDGIEVTFMSVEGRIKKQDCTFADAVALEMSTRLSGLYDEVYAYVAKETGRKRIHDPAPTVQH